MTQTATQQNEQRAEAYCAGLDLPAMRIDFVPSDPDSDEWKKWPSIAWRLSIGSHSFAYRYGIGHLKGLNTKDHGSPNSIMRMGIIAEIAKKGRPEGLSYRHLSAPKPKLADILYCLVADADVLNHSSFEDWAESFGYDTDSRKAESTYNDCMRNALALRQYINLDEAAEAFQDY